MEVCHTSFFDVVLGVLTDTAWTLVNVYTQGMSDTVITLLQFNEVINALSSAIPTCGSSTHQVTLQAFLDPVVDY